jgi:dihydropyrimidinase
MAAAPVYIAHVTCQEALGKIKEARDAGYPVYGETCPHYLLLSDEKYEGKGFEGAKYIMSPPLRDKSNQAHLWTGLASGDLQVVATDHCPFNFKGQKDLGRDDFRKIPNGVPGIENRVQLIFSEGVAKGRISLNRFVDVISTSPAKLFGLYPAKGAIAIGSDADLVVFDPQEKFTISSSANHENVDYTPYEGFKGKGVPRVVIAGGEVLVKEKKFLGKPGRGKYLKRKKFERHF